MQRDAAIVAMILTVRIAKMNFTQLRRLSIAALAFVLSFGAQTQAQVTLGELHIRNGLYTFSDRMNTYHAKMEHVLGNDYQGFDNAGLKVLNEDVAVLAALAEGIIDHPAPKAGNEAYAGLVAGLKASVDALQAATRNGDAAAAKAAIGGLKPAYTRLFAKFG
ncbi:MAG TPA: hypothetical protein DD416_07520 [Rhodobacteraceae bacterium]|jgi:hypothetical protein|nr:hypothetical protein [Paracoccaceae bacterium]